MAKGKMTGAPEKKRVVGSKKTETVFMTQVGTSKKKMPNSEKKS